MGQSVSAAASSTVNSISLAFEDAFSGFGSGVDDEWKPMDIEIDAKIQNMKGRSSGHDDLHHRKLFRSQSNSGSSSVSGVGVHSNSANRQPLLHSGSIQANTPKCGKSSHSKSNNLALISNPNMRQALARRYLNTAAEKSDAAATASATPACAHHGHKTLRVKSSSGKKVTAGRRKAQLNVMNLVSPVKSRAAPGAASAHAPPAAVAAVTFSAMLEGNDNDPLGHGPLIATMDSPSAPSASASSSKFRFSPPPKALIFSPKKDRHSQNQNLQRRKSQRRTVMKANDEQLSEKSESFFEKWTKRLTPTPTPTQTPTKKRVDGADDGAEEEKVKEKEKGSTLSAILGYLMSPTRPPPPPPQQQQPNVAADKTKKVVIRNEKEKKKGTKTALSVYNKTKPTTAPTATSSSSISSAPSTSPSPSPSPSPPPSISPSPTPSATESSPSFAACREITIGASTDGAALPIQLRVNVHGALAASAELAAEAAETAVRAQMAQMLVEKKMQKEHKSAVVVEGDQEQAMEVPIAPPLELDVPVAPPLDIPLAPEAPAAPDAPPAPAVSSASAAHAVPRHPATKHWLELDNAENTLWHELQLQQSGAAGSSLALHLDHLDETEFQRLFSSTNASAAAHRRVPSSAAPKKKLERIHVVDAKRGRNIEISLAKFRKPFEEIKAEIAVCSAWMTQEDVLDALAKIVPTEEEKEKLETTRKEYWKKKEEAEKTEGDCAVNGLEEEFVERLGTVERFFYSLRSLPADLSALFPSLQFLASFDECVSSLEDQLGVVEEACKEIRSSPSLRMILSAILKIGSAFLKNNEKAMRGITGFRLSALPRLKYIKSADKKNSLMHYLISFIHQKCQQQQQQQQKMLGATPATSAAMIPANVLEFTRTELRNVWDAAKIENNYFGNKLNSLMDETKKVEAEKKKMENMLKNQESCKQMSDDTLKFYRAYAEHLNCFFDATDNPLESFLSPRKGKPSNATAASSSSSVSALLSSLQHRYSNAVSIVHSLSEYFGEKCDRWDGFFAIFVEFFEAFESVRDEVLKAEERKKEEDKRKCREDEVKKMAEERRAKKMEKKNTPHRNSADRSRLSSPRTQTGGLHSPSVQRRVSRPGSSQTLTPNRIAGTALTSPVSRSGGRKQALSNSRQSSACGVLTPKLLNVPHCSPSSPSASSSSSLFLSSTLNKSPSKLSSVSSSSSSCSSSSCSPVVEKKAGKVGEFSPRVFSAIRKQAARRRASQHFQQQGNDENQLIQQ